MTTGELLQIMVREVSAYQNCVLDVVVDGDSARAQLIPIEIFLNEEGYEDEEE